jgi:hypothetical protein
MKTNYLEVDLLTTPFKILVCKKNVILSLQNFFYLEQN